MKDTIKEYFENHKEELLNLISELVEIPSVRGEAEEGKPFGEMPYKALEKALSIADSFGFKTTNHDGYVGTADMNGNETELAVLAHLDVVPAGDGWNTDPFMMVIDGDRILGRGVSDDKGPAMAALFAMKAVNDLGIKLSKNCRLILGTDEECGSSDLKYYFSKNPVPKYAFTPDANFPVTNGEKGRFTKNFCKKTNTENDDKKLVSINAGVAANAVPSFAKAVISGFSEDEIRTAVEKAESTKTNFEINGNEIICNGTSAHASLPENGNNPITALIEMLSNLDFDSESGNVVSSLKALFPHGKYNGESFGVDMEDKLGALTLTLDILNFDGEIVSGCFDTRTPLSATKENCANKIADKLSEYGYEIENTDMIKPHYVDENSDFVKTLLSAYEEFSGDKGDCICMGGGTYVHNIDTGVAFGAISRDTQTNMHGANEFMFIDDIITSAQIFTKVIIELCK